MNFLKFKLSYSSFSIVQLKFKVISSVCCPLLMRNIIYTVLSIGFSSISSNNYCKANVCYDLISAGKVVLLYMLGTTTWSITLSLISDVNAVVRASLI